MDEEGEEEGGEGRGGRWHGVGCSKGGPSGVGNGERRCCTRPTQTGPRFKALRAAYLSLPSFFFLPVRATAIYHLRGSVIPSRLRVSDLHTCTHTHICTYTPDRPIEESTDPAICAYNRPQTHLLRSYSFLENYWLCQRMGCSTEKLGSFDRAYKESMTNERVNSLFRIEEMECKIVRDFVISFVRILCEMRMRECQKSLSGESFVKI